MRTRLRRLQSRIPTPKISLRHISLSDLEKLEGHLLAAYETQRRIGRGRILPRAVREALETHHGLIRSLRPHEIRRILKPPTHCDSETARGLKELENVSLALLRAQQNESQSNAKLRPEKSIAGHGESVKTQSRSKAKLLKQARIRGP